MNNLQKIITNAARKKIRQFEKTVHTELANRIADRINSNKEEIASKLFSENKKQQNEIFGIPDQGILPLKKGDKVNLISAYPNNQCNVEDYVGTSGVISDVHKEQHNNSIHYTVKMDLNGNCGNYLFNVPRKSLKKK